MREVSEMVNYLEFQKSVRIAGLAISAGFLGLAGFATYLAMATALAISTALALRAAAGSFAEGLWVEVCAGIAIFAAAPVVIGLDTVHGWRARSGFLIVALAAGALAHAVNGLARSFLIEGAVGLVLLVALDVGLKHWLNRLYEKVDRITREIEQTRQEEGELPPGDDDPPA
jgi:hypothetical protein